MKSTVCPKFIFVWILCWLSLGLHKLLCLFAYQTLYSSVVKSENLELMSDQAVEIKLHDHHQTATKSAPVVDIHLKFQLLALIHDRKGWFDCNILLDSVDYHGMWIALNPWPMHVPQRWYYHQTRTHIYFHLRAYVSWLPTVIIYLKSCSSSQLQPLFLG